MNTVKIQSIGNKPYTKAFVGNTEINGIRSIIFEQSVDTVPTFTFETIGVPDIEIENADIRFRFTTETIAEAAKVIRHSIFTEEQLYDAFVESIASALKEIPKDAGTYDVAKAVADRIIGADKNEIIYG